MTGQRTPEPTNRPTTAVEWDAHGYHTVSAPQFEWGKRVLATLALRGDEIVMDAGCGTGRLTALLAERLPDGFVVGVDRSDNMAQVATETLAPFAGSAAVALADISRLPFQEAFDVVFSTATFHWVLDHDELFAGLHAVLKPSGRLHAQCGASPNLQRIHRRAQAVMETREFAEWFRAWQEPWEFATAAVTRDRLERAGFEGVEATVEHAPVVFSGADAFTAFVSTVVLRPFLARLPHEHLRKAFVARITAAAGSDDPPYELDYWRLDIRAQRSSSSSAH